MAREPDPNFMAGVPELMILRLLQDREMYGYEIVQAVRAETATSSASAKRRLSRVACAGARRRAQIAPPPRRGRSRIFIMPLAPAGLRRYQALAGNWVTLARAIQSVIKQDLAKAFHNIILGGHHVEAV